MADSFQSLVYHSSAGNHSFAPILHTVVYMDGFGTVYKQIVLIMVVVSAANQYRNGSGVVVDVAVDFRTAATVVVIDSAHTVFGT